MKTEIKEVDGVPSLVVTMPLSKPVTKEGGKLGMVFHTRGWQSTDLQIGGQRLKVNFMAGLAPKK